MALSIATWSPDGKLDGVTLKSSGAVTTDTTETAVELGKGKYRIVIAITAIDVNAADDLYSIFIDANTRNATSTWYRITPKMCFGHETATGDDDNDAADEYEIIVDNPYDYQLRVTTDVVGTVSTGITYSMVAYRLLSQH